MSPLNRDALDSIRELQSDEDPHVLVAVIDLYLKSVLTRLEAIETASLTGNGSALQAHSHSLKSSSASLGMDEVAAICAELEKFGKQNALKDAPTVAKRLRTELEASLIELKNLPEMKARESERKAA